MKPCRGPGEKHSVFLKQKHRISWAKYIWRKYKLTVEAYAWLMHSQNFACAVCLRPFDGTRKADTDHDHKTDKVRGLLCRWCNYRILSMLERGGVKRAYHAVRYLGWLSIIQQKTWDDRYLPKKGKR